MNILEILVELVCLCGNNAPINNTYYIVGPPLNDINYIVGPPLDDINYIVGYNTPTPLVS